MPAATRLLRYGWQGDGIQSWRGNAAGVFQLPIFIRMIFSALDHQYRVGQLYCLNTHLLFVR